MPATCRRAVAAAVLAAPGDEARTAHEAAEALVVAASNGYVSALAEVLRPDPTIPVPLWTVARYTAGDVSPAALEHHDDPCAAGERGEVLERARVRTAHLGEVVVELRERMRGGEDLGVGRGQKTEHAVPPGGMVGSPSGAPC